MLEGPSQHPRRAAQAPEQQYIRWILADPLHLRRDFVGLEDIIRSASASARSASRREAPGESARDRAHVLSQVQAEDLIEFGMIPEFVGRLRSAPRLERWTSRR